jgi:hypothetical protein
VESIIKVAFIGNESLWIPARVSASDCGCGCGWDCNGCVHESILDPNPIRLTPQPWTLQVLYHEQNITTLAFHVYEDVCLILRMCKRYVFLCEHFFKRTASFPRYHVYEMRVYGTTTVDRSRFDYPTRISWQVMECSMFTGACIECFKSRSSRHCNAACADDIKTLDLVKKIHFHALKIFQ